MSTPATPRAGISTRAGAPHPERHFAGAAVIRDIVIGMADGLTVPFALIAGLSGAFNSTEIVLVAGLAEIAAGGIAMGLGGYLAAKSEGDHYASERRREEAEITAVPEEEAAELVHAFERYGVTEAESRGVVGALRRSPAAMLDFKMRMELGLEPPERRRVVTSGLTIGAAYVAGGFIPLAPYFFTHDAGAALLYSVLLTAIALWFFGAVKGRFTGLAPLRSALQTLLVGGIAAGAAFTIARAL